MTDTDIPRAGLAALLAALPMPFLPGWLLEGPRRIRRLRGQLHRLAPPAKLERRRLSRKWE